MKQRLLPLAIKNPVKTELPALMALEAIGQPWFGEAHLSDLRAIALVSSLLAEESGDARSVATELIALLDASELDIDQIRPRIVALTVWMQRQPNGRVQAAITRLLRQECGLET